mmetsp:Transcript_25886/g.60104  ORF Transcript_25886/g.60104 Transcript_25886/m.60104 type:complete len:397 (+) Transcript_25886:212-1402(+)
MEDGLPDRNLCLVVHSAGNASLMQRPMPSPGPMQLLIRVEAVRVQAIPVALADGTLVAPSGKPIVPGQEFCGVVVGAGSSVDRTDFPIGTKVAVAPRSFCESCYYCERGQTNLCEMGAELFGWHVDGGYQQYVCVSHRLCQSFDKNVSWKQAILAPSAAAASYGMTKASILPGDTVLVFGTNVCSLMGIVFSRGLGAESICVVGSPGASPQQALSCGATKFVHWDPSGDEGQQYQNLRAVILEETDGRGADAVMFASDHGTGVPDMYVAVRLVRPGGCIVGVRVWEGAADADALGGEKAACIVEKLHSKDIRYISVKGFSMSLFEQALRWIEGGLLSLGPDVEDCLPLNAWDEVHKKGAEGISTCILCPQLDMVHFAQGIAPAGFYSGGVQTVIPD